MMHCKDLQENVLSISLSLSLASFLFPANYLSFLPLLNSSLFPSLLALFIAILFLSPKLCTRTDPLIDLNRISRPHGVAVSVMDVNNPRL